MPINSFTKLLVATLFIAALGIVVSGAIIAIPLIADLPTTTALVPIKPFPPARSVTYLSPLPLHLSTSRSTLQLIPITINAIVEPIPTQWPSSKIAYAISTPQK